MIKGHTTHQHDLINDPAAFLMFLNQALMKVTANHFVTAFYGVFNKVSRQFIYASAGHHSPLIISKKAIIPLSVSDSGFPLAIFDNDLIVKLIEELSLFRGTTTYDDDICVISLDV